MILRVSESSRTLSSLFLILSLNDIFGSSLRDVGISFHSLAPIFEKAILVFKLLCNFKFFYIICSHKYRYLLSASLKSFGYMTGKPFNRLNDRQ